MISTSNWLFSSSTITLLLVIHNAKVRKWEPLLWQKLVSLASDKLDKFEDDGYDHL